MKRWVIFTAAAIGFMLFSTTGCHKVNKVNWTPDLLVSGITPGQGPMQGGTTVEIQGVDFQSGASVHLGLTTVDPVYVTVLDSTRIRFITPEAALPGPVDVTVTNPGGRSFIFTSAYTYTTWFSDPSPANNPAPPNNLPYVMLPRRLPVTVTVAGSVSAQTDYQVRVEIPYDSEMEPDFEDVRFSWLDTSTSPDSEAAIPFWLESFTSFDRAVFWVKVPALPAGAASAMLYAYYGDSASLLVSPLDTALPPSDF
ncbi:MAG: IPT/TIG domain-containing protein, partial [Planctomycetota bacterium]